MKTQYCQNAISPQIRLLDSVNQISRKIFCEINNWLQSSNEKAKTGGARPILKEKSKEDGHPSLARLTVKLNNTGGALEKE